MLEVRGTSRRSDLPRGPTIRDLTRKVAPGQRLAAFDAETAIIGAQRERRRCVLRRVGIGMEQAISRQEALVNVSASRTDEGDVAARGRSSRRR